MPDLTNVNTSNTVRSVGGASQKNINNNPGRPNRTIGNAQAGQGGRVSTERINAEETTYADKINGIRENAIKTIKMDIAEKALRDAGIEINQATLDIVKSLINGSLPLTDKNIVNLMEFSHIFKNVPTDVLALMMRLEIPMTPENVEQFQKLINANEKLSDKIGELINKLPNEILQNSRSLPELSDTLTKLLDIISKKDTGGELTRANSNNTSNNTQGNTAEPLLTRSELSGLLSMLRALKAPENVLNQLLTANRNGNTQIQNITNQQNANTQNNQVNQQNQNIQGNNAQAPSQTRSDSMLNIINSFIRDISLQTHSTNPASGSISSASGNNAAETVKNPETHVFNAVKDLLNSGEFQKLLKESMGEKWLINPKNFNPEKITDFYNKLNENLNSLESRFAKLNQNSQTNQNNQNNQVRQSAELNQPNQAHINQPQVFTEAKNIRDNLSLMNEISKTMPFLQIPVKFANQTVNSDLYIFQNKKKTKNGANPAGGINALLRLDLENAGAVDIYINMSGKNIRSRFYSKNMLSLREFEKNLPELDEVISKMGFNFKSVASTDEKGFDFVGDFINRGVPKAQVRKYILNMKI